MPFGVKPRGSLRRFYKEGTEKNITLLADVP